MIDSPVTPRSIGRRGALLAGLAAGVGVLTACGSRTPTPTTGSAPAPGPAPFADRMADLEARFHGRVGVAALDTATGARLGHRADERFLMCSTVKVATVATVLARSVADPGLLARHVRWSRADLLSYAPVTTRALNTGLTVAELCAAAITVSDNTAANLLSAQVGGPGGVTAFLRGLGDNTSRADRTEPTLNDLAGDLDTTTPTAFVATLRTVLLGAALPPDRRARLVGWMTANTTGAAQIRAATPRGATVADKTGSGAASEANDVGLVWLPGRSPILLAVYTSPADPRNQTGHATIAAATAEVLRAFGAPSR